MPETTETDIQNRYMLWIYAPYSCTQLQHQVSNKNLEKQLLPPTNLQTASSMACLKGKPGENFLSLKNPGHRAEACKVASEQTTKLLEQCPLTKVKI